MAHLRDGDHVGADVIAIEAKRRKLEELQQAEDEAPGMYKDALHDATKKDRNKLIAGIDAIVETNRQEALNDPANAGKTSSEAIRERLSAILDKPDTTGTTTHSAVPWRRRSARR